MARLSISLALEHYDRHMPFVDGSVRPNGFDLRTMFVGQSGENGGRHERMIHHLEFDAAELSLGSYVMAKARGAALTAIPVFPRRLFSPSQMYVNAEVGIEKPADLVGKRVALRTFQTTLSILAKGDLATEYGVPLEGPDWVTTAAEPVPFDPPPGVRIERLAPGRSLGEALTSGEVSAYLSPRPPRPFLEGSPKVRRLFADPRAEEVRYFESTGFYPIMHVVALRSELAEQHPWLPVHLMEAFEQSKAAWSHYLDDPNWSQLAWSAYHRQEQRALLGADPWPYGFAANRANLERFIGYEHAQGLIPKRFAAEELFFPTVRET
jgi:4,5-dihydroxyphthalate decarboxylase